ncbi:MAG: zinc-ribbon domain-containing protein [Lachnospiraceae bacterium]|nr:zinc-ribbon domain-containing protein [Butyrivibrio sp.]MCM1342576.1 zinc-ribbon domain-containing protein [Muribaculaceae bacterium]MCM1411950.1 zinc-ribbon domain-containing protein [Lachnospiraceae bacterium]
MFCHQCGTELREDARFCFHCGAPAGEDPAQDGSADSSSDSQGQNPQPSDPLSAPQETTDTETPVTCQELRLTQKHYIRKPGKKKFKRKKETSVIPVSTILGTSAEHHKYGVRIFLSLALLLCFAAGALFSARCCHRTYEELNLPYRDEELAALESVLSVIDGDGAFQLLQYQNAQEDNRTDSESLSAKLDELKAQQTKERSSAICNGERFDLDDLFHRDLFSQAYRDYLQDLLNAFKADELLDSWLYSYYETAKAYGGNDFLDTDMWIYHGSGGDKFSPGLDSADSLMKEQYDLDLYEHILYTGRIYITGADFMREILALPGYVVNGAVFARAFGGTAMAVPGWSRSHYEEFWLYPTDYYDVDTPIWLDQGFRAGNFDLDWNALIDESAYYDAYQDLMDKIAPGLPRYEMALYHADDAAYGGIGCDLRGTEASLSDIVDAYVRDHPEFMDELMENKNCRRLLATSVDAEIAETEAQLEKLEEGFLDLQEREKELARLLEDAQIYRNAHMLLLTDMERHSQELTRFLLLFGGGVLLCAFGTLVCLYRAIDLMRRPRHLFLISGQDMEYAFDIRHYSQEQISALHSRLSPRSDQAGEN